jgi:hypothetical protein
MAGGAAIEIFTSLPTDSLYAEWPESGMQFQRVKVGFQSKTDFRYAAKAAGHGAMLPSVSSGLEVPPAATLSTWV